MCCIVGQGYFCMYYVRDSVIYKHILGKAEGGLRQLNPKRLIMYPVISLIKRKKTHDIFL